LNRYTDLKLLGQNAAALLILPFLPLLLPALITGFLFLAPIKVYLKFTCGMNRSKKRLDGKTALVTGGSKGIGKEIAKDLANRGARVIICSRHADVGTAVAEEIVKETHNNQVVFRAVDLSQMKDVRRFAEEFQANESRLDILVNNAGASDWDRTVAFTDERLEKKMATNYFGPFLLTQQLLGLISSSSGRIINASSLMHRRVQHLDLDNFDFHKGVGPFMDVYSISKLCIILWTRLLALRLKDTAVTVNCYHPGVVDTDMMVAPQAWINVLLWIPRRFFFKTPFEGAQMALYLATSDQGGSVSGEYFADCKVAKTSELAKDMVLAQRLWNKTEALLTPTTT